MNTAFERFICRINETLGVNDATIMHVSRMSDVGTVVTFEISIGKCSKAKATAASIIFEAAVAKGGIQVKPRNIVQVCGVSDIGIGALQMFLTDVVDRRYYTFLIKWPEYERFLCGEESWIKDTLQRYVDEQAAEW